MTRQNRPWRVKYDGACARCGRLLHAGEPAVYERATRTIRCVACPDAETPADDTAGASARREYARRHDAREARVRERFGERFGGFLLAASDDPQSTTAWKRGAQGEEDVAAALQGIPGIQVLHDRGIPGSRGNIDHIVVAPTGVYVIDTKRYAGMIRIRDRGTLLRRDERLYVGRRDRSALADGVASQVEIVRGALASADVPVTPVLCFVDAEWPLLRRPTTFRGVRLERPKSLASMLTVAVPAEAVDISTVARRLERALPTR